MESRLSIRALTQVLIAYIVCFLSTHWLVVQPLVQRLAETQSSRLDLLSNEFARQTASVVYVNAQDVQEDASDFSRIHQVRVRLLRGDGTVAFDARAAKPVGENNFRAALQLDHRFDIKFVELSPLDANAAYVIWFTLAGFAAALIVAATLWNVAGWNSAIQSIRSTCESVTTGDFARRAAVERNDEFGELAEAVNRLCRELDARIARLMDGNERLSAILGGMVEGVVAVDEATKILFANDQARRLLGITSDQLEGRPLHESVRNHALQSLLDQRPGESNPLRSEIVLDGDPPRVISAYSVKPRYKDAAGRILILDDVTDVRRLESIRRDFVANVSHELKTPLSAILAYVETLLAGAIDDREHNRLFLTRVQDSAVRLERLIQDLLSLARIESGEEVYSIEDVPIYQLIDDCFKEHATAAVVKGIIMMNEQGPAEVCVRADDEGVWQIFRNLVDNAIKYTPEGGRITVKWTADEKFVQVSVTDTGIGISDADQQRLFERFYRVDKARSRELGGTGLGLAIVKHLCMAFGGQVKILSEEGRGSTFTVTLPRGEDLPNGAH